MLRHHVDRIGFVEWLIPILLFAALIGVITYALLVLIRRPPATFVGPAGHDPAVEAARLRYARGEMSRDDYARIVADLGGAPPAAAPPSQPPPQPAPPPAPPPPPAAPPTQPG